MVYIIIRYAGGERLEYRVTIKRRHDTDKTRVLIESVPGTPYIYGWCDESELTPVST